MGSSPWGHKESDTTDRLNNNDRHESDRTADTAGGS